MDITCFPIIRPVSSKWSFRRQSNGSGFPPIALGKIDTLNDASTPTKLLTLDNKYIEKQRQNDFFNFISH